MMPKRILVTGGTGVIGAWIVRGLVERGLTPIVFVRGSTDHIGRTINGDLDDRVIWAYGDLLEPLTLLRAIQQHRAEAIIHMASAKPWQIEPPFVSDPKVRQGLEQIVLASANLLEVARTAGIRRVVYASSKAVYDHVRGVHGPPTYLPLPENYPLNPHLLYGIGKVAAEQLGSYYADHFGLEVLAIRFASSYGPLKRGPASLSADGMLQAALAGQTVTIFRFPDGQKDDFVYNKDVAEGFVLAALAENPTSRAFNLGSGRGLDHDDLAAAIRVVQPDARIEIVDPPPDLPGLAIIEQARCIMDISRAAAELGYAPRFADLEQAFQDILAEETRMKAQQAPVTAGR